MIDSCPYRTLGVSKNATQDEIKAAFRKLSKETHPDTAGVAADPERFKIIAQAANVLTNQRNRRAYDQRVQSQRMPRAGFAGSQRPRTMTPRHLWVLPVTCCAAFVVHLCTSTAEKPASVREKETLVQAWMNPQTGRYETPAPWDPVFRRLNPTLEQVPRNLVRRRSR